MLWYLDSILIEFPSSNFLLSPSLPNILEQIIVQCRFQCCWLAPGIWPLVVPCLTTGCSLWRVLLLRRSGCTTSDVISEIQTPKIMTQWPYGARHSYSRGTRVWGGTQIISSRTLSSINRRKPRRLRSLGNGHGRGGWRQIEWQNGLF